MRIGQEFGSLAAGIEREFTSLRTGIEQKVEPFKTQVEVNRVILESAVSREAYGPLGFMVKHYPTRIGAFMVTATTCLFDRLFFGKSPEKNQ